MTAAVAAVRLLGFVFMPNSNLRSSKPLLVAP
jgi:hypothetical protein